MVIKTAMRFRFSRIRVRRLWKTVLVIGILTFFSPLFYLHVKNVYLHRNVIQVNNKLDVELKENKHHFADAHVAIRNSYNVNVTVKPTIKVKKAAMVRKGTTYNKTGTFIESSNAAIERFKSLKHSPYTLLAGVKRSYKGNITIGIPSVRRLNTNVLYLTHTLNSIIRATSDSERESVTIVILLSDGNSTYKSYVVHEITTLFRQYVESGFINIIELKSDVYPDLKHVKVTFKDPRPRLIWRAKQNIDFAYLMLYGKNLSTYYLQLEDDVIAAENFLQDIYHFINIQKTNWFLLEFSYLGFIGKFFKSADISWVGQFLLQHYDHAPCDLLLGGIRTYKNQIEPLHANVTLFQHIGKFSSLKNKLMPSVDRLFKDKGNLSVDIIDIPTGVYPKAAINVSLDTYEDYVPQNAYDGDVNSFFWGKTAKMRDSFTLTFKSPQNFSRIVILSGHSTLYTDRIYSARLYAASALNSSEQRKEKHGMACGEYKAICDFVDGQVDTLVTGSNVPTNIGCLMIFFNKSSRWWSIIREIILVR